MTTELRVTTTGTGSSPLVFNDLGEYSFPHPTTALDVLSDGGFPLDQVLNSLNFQTAITNGWMTVTDENSNPITNPAAYFTSDNRSKVSSGDTSPNFLFSKLAGVSGKTTLTKLNPGANESVQVTIGADVFDKTVDDTDDITAGTTNKFVTANQRTALDCASTPTGANPLVTRADKLSVLSATTSAELAGVISDETGTGALVFATSPTLVTPTLGSANATNITFSTGGAERTGTTVGNTMLIQAYNTTGASYTTFATLTAGTTPTMDLADTVTKAGQYIYRAAGTDVPVTDGGTGVSSLTAYGVLCGGTTSTSTVQALASLGTSGQILTSNGAGALPSFQTAGGGGSGTVNRVGTWNASTNSPALANGGGSTKGSYYVVSVNGTTTLDGISNWRIGDWVISSGTAWEKVDNAVTVNTNGNLLTSLAPVVNYLVSDASVTTNTSTLATKASGTTATLAIGKYKLTCTATFNSSNTSSVCEVLLSETSPGTVDHIKIGQSFSVASIEVIGSGIALLTVSSASTYSFSIKYRRTAGTGTVTITNCRFFLEPINGVSL